MRSVKEFIVGFIVGLIALLCVSILSYLLYFIVDYFICINEDDIGTRLFIGFSIFAFIFMITYILKSIGKDVKEYIGELKKQNKFASYCKLFLH